MLSCDTFSCDTLIRDVRILDGSGGKPTRGDVAVRDGSIVRVGELEGWSARDVVDSGGKTLAPGFIDAHTHDDLYLIRSPEMLPKLSQGVTTVVVGNCGISGAPVRLQSGLKREALTDPMNLLGEAGQFRYATFAEYVAGIAEARPAVNVAALVGHMALRNNFMDRLDRGATADEIAAMRGQLCEALQHGALGLSTGLAYASAYEASTDEVMALAEPLAAAGAIYATHLRSESAGVFDAVDEAVRIGSGANVPVVISHLKCTGIDQWGKSSALLGLLARVRGESAGWDCYPYAASSSTLDLKQVDERVKITITWSKKHPEMAGKTLAVIAGEWKVGQVEAAQRLQPAGAIYYGMSEEDVRAILRHPRTMIGSDGLPNDPRPHPRLWGTFPRVLGVFAREQKLFSMSEAVRKMTSLPAQRFGLTNRGWVREGYAADLVLFDAATVRDAATFEDSTLASIGIEAVWVNGVLSYSSRGATDVRAGKFLPRTTRS